MCDKYVKKDIAFMYFFLLACSGNIQTYVDIYSERNAQAHRSVLVQIASSLDLSSALIFGSNVGNIKKSFFFSSASGERASR